MEIKTKLPEPTSQQLIVRQCCLKASIELLVGMMQSKDYDVKTIPVSEQVIVLAGRFEEWVWRKY